MLSSDGSIKWVVSSGGGFSGPDSNFDMIDLPIYQIYIYIYSRNTYINYLYIVYIVYIEREREI